MSERLRLGAVFFTVSNLICAASMFALVSVQLPAQEAVPVGASPVPAEVQLEASRIFVFADKTGLGHQHAVEARLLSSTLVLGADQAAGKLVFDMASFDADTERARKRLGLKGTTDEATRSAVNENMHSAAVLDVAKYPTATFEIASAKATGAFTSSGNPTYLLEGNFTLHGTTKPQAITVHAEQVRGWLHVRGGFAINQSAFGIKPYTKALGAIGVADELKIYGELFVVPTEKVNLNDIPVRP